MTAFRSQAMSAALVAALALFGAPAAEAGDTTAGKLTIKEAWTRVTPPGAGVAGGFMTITNAGSEPDRLVGGATAISKRVEVHEMSMEAGIMKMRPIEKGLEIKPGETVELKPGGFHMMFIDLTGAPAIGTPVKGQLVFEKAGTVDIEYTVAPLGARALNDSGGSQGAQGHHGHH